MLWPAVAATQTLPRDTLAINELDEVTVTAAMQHNEADKSVYMPTGQQKSVASDGASLLAAMNIPQLSVNPISGAVKTSGGQSASLFINYHPASTEDIAALNPADVMRVEYMDFPADPRFLRAQHVVNFILRAYAYGGYTKLNARERLMLRSGDASAYSKFAYRRMVYDFMMSGSYDYNPYIGTESLETYRLRNSTVMRESTVDTSRSRERGLFAALRASWEKDETLSLRNMLTYRRNHTPMRETSGRVSFSALYPTEQYSADSQSTGNSLSWDSELYLTPGRGWSLNGTANVELLVNNTHDSYSTAASDIDNKADEDSRSVTGNFHVNKALSDKLTLFANLSGSDSHIKIRYSGTSDALNRFRQTFAGLYIGLALNFQHVSGSVDGGYAWESNRINGKNINDRYPFTHINLQYAPNSKHAFSMWFQYATFSPDAVMKNPNMIRRSELMYIVGNPDIKASRHISANVSYTWLPAERWQLMAYISMFRIIGRQIEVYVPDGPDGMMLRKYANDGDYNHGQVGARLTCRLFGGNLALSAAPRLLLYRITGSNSATHTPFTGSLSADYYLGEFFFNAYWESRWSYVDGGTSFLRKMPSSYSIAAGWASKGWNIRAALNNFLRSSWHVSHDTLSTEWYDSALTQFGPFSHRSISVSLTYTFSYGRKTDDSGELSGEGGISSSILR